MQRPPLLVRLLLLSLLAGCGPGDAPTPKKDRSNQDTSDEEEDDPPRDLRDPSEEEEEDLFAVDAALAIVHGDTTYASFGAYPQLGDLTGNGHLDLVAYAAGGQHNRTYLVQGPLQGMMGVTHKTMVVPNGWAGLAVGDFDDDGQLDLAVGSQNLFDQPKFELYYGPLPAKGTRPPDAILAPNNSPWIGSTCDANGDGIPDLVMASVGKSLTIALGPLQRHDMGAEAASLVIGWTSGVFSPSIRYICGEDLTASGKPQILIANQSHPVDLWLVEDPPWDGGTYAMEEVGERLAITSGGSVLSVAGDVTGNGYLDVLVGRRLIAGPIHADSETYALLEWDSTNSSVIRLGDLNGDGQDDLVLGVPGAFSGGGAVVVKYGPVQPGTYKLDDMDLILRNGELGDYTGFGRQVAVDATSGLWAVGASKDDGAYTGEGRVYVFHGDPTP